MIPTFIHMGVSLLSSPRGAKHATRSTVSTSALQAAGTSIPEVCVLHDHSNTFLPLQPVAGPFYLRERRHLKKPFRFLIGRAETEMRKKRRIINLTFFSSNFSGCMDRLML
jgi:hypothetical protein